MQVRDHNAVKPQHKPATGETCQWECTDCGSPGTGMALIKYFSYKHRMCYSISNPCGILASANSMIIFMED